MVIEVKLVGGKIVFLATLDVKVEICLAGMRNICTTFSIAYVAPSNLSANCLPKQCLLLLKVTAYKTKIYVMYIKRPEALLKC